MRSVKGRTGDDGVAMTVEKVLLDYCHVYMYVR